MVAVPHTILLDSSHAQLSEDTVCNSCEGKIADSTPGEFGFALRTAKVGTKLSLDLTKNRWKDFSI
jgi:hypothetical protein